MLNKIIQSVQNCAKRNSLTNNFILKPGITAEDQNQVGSLGRWGVKSWESGQEGEG